MLCKKAIRRINTAAKSSVRTTAGGENLGEDLDDREREFLDEFCRASRTRFQVTHPNIYNPFVWQNAQIAPLLVQEQECGLIQTLHAKPMAV
ncbi:MAG: hypothetical protein ACXV3T_06590 [Halobacteriota archaeon]